MQCGQLHRKTSTVMISSIQRHYIHLCRQVCVPSSYTISSNRCYCKERHFSKQQRRSYTTKINITTDQTTSSSSQDHNNYYYPPRLSISKANHLLHTNQAITPQQLCHHAHNLATFGETSLHLNAHVHLLSLQDVLDQAQLSHERIRSGLPKSRLDGIPVTIKANVAVGSRWGGLPHSSSRILVNGQVVENNDNDTTITTDNYHDVLNGCNDDGREVYQSDIAKRLLNDCGAVLIGITNMDEFGMGSLGLNSGVSMQNSSGHNHDHVDHDNDVCNSRMEQQYLDKRQYNSNPTYNPLPWMHRLSMIQTPPHHQWNQFTNEQDGYWIDLIQNSTVSNPHGISDETALNDLLDEIQYWTQQPTPPSQTNHPDNTTVTTTTFNNTTSSPLLSPGGSSSGAAATIAHGSSLLSIGTDTGGSLRLPSAWTSTVGFKPTYGTFSRYGVVSYASSLDTVGFITGSVECAKIGWECLSVENTSEVEERSVVDFSKSRDATARVYHDDQYHTTLLMTQHEQESTESNSSSNDATKSLAGIRIGIPSAFSLQETPFLIAKSWSAAANTLQNVGGATLVPIPESVVSSEWIKLSCAAYYVLACAEASSNLSRYDGVRFGLNVDLNKFANVDNLPEYEQYHPLSGMTALEEKICTTRVLGFGDEVQRRVLAGTSVLSSDRFHTHYEAAAIVRAKVSQSMERAFRSSSAAAMDNDGMNDDEDKVDVMLVPTALSFPCTLNPKLGDEMMEDMDPTAAFGNDVMTIPISLGGFPSISVPFTDDDANSDHQVKDVVGMQVFGMRGSEDVVLQVANVMDNHSC